jgi:hypothetical protein
MEKQPMTRMKLLTTMSDLNIQTEQAIFSIVSDGLLAAIADEVDLETVTNHELREIYSIVRMRLSHLNWKELVSHAINHLPFGLNQTGIAWNCSNPCRGCPDAMIEDSSCYHQQECKAWEIYEART